MLGRSGQIKVLLVDPDADRRLGSMQQLRELGCAVEFVSRVDERSASAEPVDVAIVVGSELAASCRACVEAKLATAILALVEPQADGSQVADAIAAGATDCLAHPTTTAELAVRLSMIEARRSSAAAQDAEAALRASEAGMRTVLQAAPDGILVHRNGRFVYVNPTAVRWLGFASAEAASGASIYDYVIEEDAAAARERVAALQANGESVAPRDFQFKRVDGDIRVGEVVSVAASFEGEPSIITIIRDVGEQRRMQSQMFLADRLATVGTLAVGVAHEINNPLAWVVGNLGLLADEFDNQVRMRELPGHDPVAVSASRARVRELLGRAQEGTERVRRIVRDLVRFGRSDDEEHQVVDVHALLDSTIEIADVHLRHRARLARDYRSRGFARGSEARLGQVFLNLLVNAGQAIPAGAPRQNQVKVETRDIDDGWVEIAISDTGCGMPEHVRKRVFEPFFTTKPVGEGTGIGLALSHDIVVSFGGEILIESEVGRGTTFRVRLRRAVEDTPSRPGLAIRDEPDSPRASNVVRVLVVDDEPLIREMVCDALSAHEVTAVSNGRDALEQLLTHDWELVLCDMILPEISGLDVYRELEQKRPEILDKLVFMTGGEFSRKGPRLPSGARIRRLEKPFSLRDLRALVRDARRQA